MYSTFIREVHTEDLKISDLDCIRHRGGILLLQDVWIQHF